MWEGGAVSKRIDVGKGSQVKTWLGVGALCVCVVTVFLVVYFLPVYGGTPLENNVF